MDTQASCRRRRRSDNKDIAVQYQLSDIADTLDLDAIVVSDELGHMVTFSGDKRKSEILADSAMWSSLSDANLDDVAVSQLRAIEPDFEAAHVARETVKDDRGQRFHIFALGKSWGRHAAAQHAAETVARIHGLETPNVADTARANPQPRWRDSGVRWVIGLP